MKHPSALIPTLAKVLRRPETVLFIGSGISSWSGAPMWRPLLDKLADTVDGLGTDTKAARRHTKENLLLDAAGLLTAGISRAELGNFLRETCNLAKLKPHDIHRLICSLGPTCFITTNYDHLIENTVRKIKPDQNYLIVSNQNFSELANLQKAQANNFIFKMHGDMNDANSIVLSQDHYDALIHGPKAVLETLKTLLMSRPVVFFRLQPS